VPWKSNNFMEAAMAGMRIFGVHRTWEDWLGVLLGVVIVLSPWFAGQEGHENATLNAGVIGVLVFTLGAIELVELYRWEEIGEIACGFWLIVSPYVFGYAGTTLQYWHFGLGAVVALLAMAELWQDRGLSDTQLAEHGQK
jgi:hypothetical protein